MTFDPTSVEITCDSTQGSLHLSPMKIRPSMWIQWPFFKNLNQRSLTPKWPLTPAFLRSHVWLYPRITVSKTHENTSVCGYSDPFFKNLNRRSLTPTWPLTPHFVEVTCVILPKDHCVKFPWKYINVCRYSDQFCKSSTKTTTYYVHTTYYGLRTEWVIT